MYQAVTLLIAVVLMAGCATSEVTERRSYAGGEFVAKPGRILSCLLEKSSELTDACKEVTAEFSGRLE